MGAEERIVGYVRESTGSRAPTPARARALAESRGAGRRYRRETETLSEYEAALTRLPRKAST
jgi:hypothetical protein